MDYYDKYLKYKNKYITCKSDIFNVVKESLLQKKCLLQNKISLNPSKRGNLSISILSKNNNNGINTSDKLGDVRNTLLPTIGDVRNTLLPTIGDVRNTIISIISSSYISPEFQFGLGEDNIDLINHINNFFKHKYVESINGNIIANRKNLIQDILSKLNISFDTHTFNTIILEKKIFAIDKKLKKFQKIIDINNNYNNNITIRIHRIKLLTANINKLIEQKNILLYIIDFINKNYKIFNTPPIKRHLDDGNTVGKNVEDIINNKIKKILQDNINNNNIICDVMYISNLDYHRMMVGMNTSYIFNDCMKFKQEIDGLICIKLSDDTWYPIIIIETKTNINLIYTDINKLNALYDRLQFFDNFIIGDNNNIYTIVGKGFKNINMFYCVREIDNMIDGKYIKFIYNNHYTRRTIYDIIMSEIKSKIQNIDLFNDVEELNNYIMNILYGKSYLNNNYNNILSDRTNLMKRELIERLTSINTSEQVYNIISQTIYSNHSYNYFNYNKGKYAYNETTYNFLELVGIITPEIINRIENKINEISCHFIKFNNRSDTKILFIN